MQSSHHLHTLVTGLLATEILCGRLGEGQTHEPLAHRCQQLQEKRVKAHQDGEKLGVQATQTSRIRMAACRRGEGKLFLTFFFFFFKCNTSFTWPRRSRSSLLSPLSATNRTILRLSARWGKRNNSPVKLHTSPKPAGVGFCAQKEKKNPPGCASGHSEF